MRQIDRILIGTLVVGVWSLVALQVTSTTHAQEGSAADQGTQSENLRMSKIVVATLFIAAMGITKALPR